MRQTPLQTAVAGALSRSAGLTAGQTVVVALSGGPDSVALLDALTRLAPARSLRVVAAHLDHGLRPGSRADAAFCRGLCRRLGVPLRTARTDVRGRAEREGGGLEEAARVERYAFLRRVKDAAGARAIALAHTRDDQAETFLLRLLRGSGRVGLACMRERSGDLFRPLLGVGRADVLAHLRERGLEWVEDPTNADTTLLRNRVRAELLPYLERRFNPSLREALARAAAVMADEADVLDALAADLRQSARTATEGTVALSRRTLAAAPRAIARLALRQALGEAGGLRGVTAVHVERLLALIASPRASGRSLALPGGRAAVVHFDELRMGPAVRPAAIPFALELPVPGRVTLPGGRTLEARPVRGPAPARPADPAEVVLRVPAGTLLARTRRPGDRVRLGRREVSLKRYLMDRRVPAAERPTLPLVASGSRVLWVPGHLPEPEEDAGGRFVRIKLRTTRREAGDCA
ncbi:MAG TPA: tRNA lysidine(34) synthetase TilS [Vicinamibacteria bacterium]